MATKTVQLADKLTLDEIKAILTDDNYGLKSLSELIETESSKPLMSVALLDSNYKSNWESMSSLPYAFYYSHGAVIYNGDIHILGGFSNYAPTAHYKWDGIKWTSVSTLPAHFYYGCAISYKNEIHILGGTGDMSGRQYVLSETIEFPDIYLLKDTKIYASADLVAVYNCSLNGDHLVVTEDGTVRFSAKASTISSNMVTMIN